VLKIFIFCWTKNKSEFILFFGIKSLTADKLYSYTLSARNRFILYILQNITAQLMISLLPKIK